MQTTFTPPYAQGFLRLDDTHRMYWQQSGRIDGQPIVLVHGGPGAGMDEGLSNGLDTRHFRVVAYDQRGVGRSQPVGELVNNTTRHLVADLERLRQHLGIEQWSLMGGSWGSSLSLAYAEAHPERVTGLILRGVFLCRQCELDWYFSGVRHIFPEAWRRFIQFLPAEERDQPLQAYYRRIHAPEPDLHRRAAAEWCLYEASRATLLPDTGPRRRFDTQQGLVLARVQTHYFANGFFLDEDELLDNIHRIRSIPAEIVHGRYDMICPTSSAETLHRAWPDAHYRIVPNAGHAETEPGIRRALMAAAERSKVYDQPTGGSQA